MLSVSFNLFYYVDTFRQRSNQSSLKLVQRILFFKSFGNTDNWDAQKTRYPHFFSIVSNNFYTKFDDAMSNGIEPILKIELLENIQATLKTGTKKPPECFYCVEYYLHQFFADSCNEIEAI